MIRLLLAVLISLSLIGCTTMKAVAPSAPSAPNQVVVGDDVRVTTKAGKTYALEITEVTADAMIGREKTGKRWKVPFEQIQTLEVEKVSAAKTVGLGLGITVLLWVAAIVATGYALGESLDNK